MHLAFYINNCQFINERYDRYGLIRDAEAAYLRAPHIDPGYALARGNLRGLKASSDPVR